MLARSTKSLQEITTAVDEETSGAAVSISPSDNDGVNNQDQAFVAVFNLTAANGSSPTLDAYVETSWNGTDWYTIASMTQLVGAGTKKQLVVATPAVGPFVRGRVLPGGTTAPDVTGTIDLASSGTLR